MLAELQEEWAWYVVGMVIILTRFAVRIRTVGLKGFQGDDYMSMMTIIFFTLDAIIVQVVSDVGDNLGITKEQAARLTSSEIARKVYGSKMELTAWYSYSSIIWSMKFTMLFFYKRLTLGSLHEKLVKWLFWIIGAAYVAIFLTVSLGCYPIQMNWQVVPIPPLKCSLRLQNLIVITILNILTDAAILAIPIPMLQKLRVPMRKKIAIGFVLSSGLFVIAAAIIRVSYSLGPHPSASNIDRWGVRETIIGIFAVNIPILRPLLGRSFWVWGAYDPQSKPSTNGSRPYRGRRLDDTDGNKDIELATTTIKSSTPNRSESQEKLTWNKEDVVFVQTTYDIQTHDRDDMSLDKKPDWSEMRLPR
ncbi:hypothetical protein BDV97DRAFT_403328 [Delphinella strobiligena]|nr:hypothetical protein BDV97DRAFT_403328 [Delphinella strobiligena]